MPKPHFYSTTATHIPNPPHTFPNPALIRTTINTHFLPTFTRQKQAHYLMAQIALEGMWFYAYHGHYEEEKLCGGEYEVDVYLNVQVDRAAIQDKLEHTLNYETIYLICQIAMKTRAQLIETVAERIALGLKNQFGFIKEMKVRVRKLNPPLEGPVKAAIIEVDGSFNKRCARCNKPMLCYGDKTCWCMDVPPTLRGTKEHLKIEFNNQCLCKECLTFYAPE